VGNGLWERAARRRNAKWLFALRFKPNQALEK